MNWEALGPFWMSLRVAGGATVAATLLAAPLAWVMARRNFPGKTVLLAVLLMPLVLPPTVIGFGLLYVLGRHGLLGVVTGGYSILFTPLAATVAAAVVAFPLVLLPAQAAFAALDPVYLEEAVLLGASRRQLIWHVGLPLAGRGIASGIILGFARGLGEFGATLMVIGTAQHLRTLPVQIYVDAALTNDIGNAWPAVAVLAAISLVVAVVVQKIRF